MENVYTKELRKLVAEFPNTNAWKRGVKEYTDELLDNLEKRHSIMKDFLEMKKS